MPRTFSAVALEPVEVGAMVTVQVFESGRTIATVDRGRLLGPHELRRLLVDLLAEMDGLPPVAAEEVELHRARLERLEQRVADVAELAAHQRRQMVDLLMAFYKARAGLA